jgi:hypothetical protein
MRRVFAIILFATLASAPSYPARAQDEQPCYPSGARTVAQSQEVRVYRTGPLRELVGCHLPTGRATKLDFRTSSFAFPRVAVNGPLVAWVLDISDAEQRPGSTRLFVADLSVTPPADDRVVTVPAGFTEFAKLGSIVLRRSGGVAWIACRSDDCRVATRGRPASSRGAR